MKVLVLGGTGYVGSQVTERLAELGHQMLVPSRARADLRNPGSLRRAVDDDVDVIVNAGPALSEGIDIAAVDALLATGKKLIYTSGTWVLGETGRDAADIGAPLNPIEIVSWRGDLERRVLQGGGCVVRLGMVHGRGGGIPSLFVAQAAEHGAGRYVGDPSPRCPMVHVDDAADLFALVVEKADPGTLWHAVAEEGVYVRELARAASALATGSDAATPWSIDEAANVFGRPFAEALALNHAVTGQQARKRLGWSPTRPGAVEDVRRGSYRAPARRMP